MSPRFGRFASRPDSDCAGVVERSRLTEVEAVVGVGSDSWAFSTSGTESGGGDGEGILVVALWIVIQI